MGAMTPLDCAWKWIEHRSSMHSLFPSKYSGIDWAIPTGCQHTLDVRIMLTVFAQVELGQQKRERRPDYLY